MRLFSGQYEKSARDYIAAADELERLETYSVSKGTATWVVNDTVQDFRGTPYERTLLHAFTAKDHLAMANWDDAAVEARDVVDGGRRLCKREWRAHQKHDAPQQPDPRARACLYGEGRCGPAGHRGWKSFGGRLITRVNELRQSPGFASGRRGSCVCPALSRAIGRACRIQACTGERDKLRSFRFEASPCAIPC